MESYSIFNPIIWGIFIGGNLLIFIAIMLFHARYPHLSEMNVSREQSLQVKDIMSPATVFSDHTKIIVHQDDSIVSLYPLFLKYEEDHFYVRNEEGLIGSVSLDGVLGINSKRVNKEMKGVQANEYSTGA